MSLINWVIDSLASKDVIDLYFVLTDLVDIKLTESEVFESACFDSLASTAVREHKGDIKIPLGKQVL